mmetsp:Transcript_24926/g.40011  ORF Transcript_24926/g.40011 Transcript_24926/m.40011 type:complete len:932 (-) Transcript_24926:121-2916(-)
MAAILSDEFARISSLPPTLPHDSGIGCGSDDAALEALERLARDFAAAEAERVAALGCAEHLGRLLCDHRAAGKNKGCKNLRKRSGFAAAARSAHVADKENSFDLLNTCTVLDTTRESLSDATTADTSKNSLCCTPDVLEHDSVPQKARLASVARRMGALRAECAQHRDQSASLKNSLAQSRQALERQSVAVLSLRGQISALQERLEKNRNSCHDAANALQHAPLAVLQARSDLHRMSCEAAQIERKTSELQALSVAESEAWHEELQGFKEKQRREEAKAIVEHNAVRAELSELMVIRETLKREEVHAESLRRQQMEQHAQSERLHATEMHSSESLLRAWRNELQAQRAVAHEQSVENARHCASLAEFSAREAQLEAHLQLSTHECRQAQASIRNKRDEIVSEEHLCKRLAGRLKSRDRSIKDLRHEQGRWESQRRALGELEKHLQVLTNRLAHGNVSNQSVSMNVPTRSGSMCTEEATQILLDAVTRMGGSCSGRVVGSTPWPGALERLSATLVDAARALQQQLLVLFPLFNEIFHPTGKRSRCSQRCMSLREMLSSLLEISCPSNQVTVRREIVAKQPRDCFTRQQCHSVEPPLERCDLTDASTVMSPMLPKAEQCIVADVGVEADTVPQTILSCTTRGFASVGSSRCGFDDPSEYLDTSAHSVSLLGNSADSLDDPCSSKRAEIDSDSNAMRLQGVFELPFESGFGAELVPPTSLSNKTISVSGRSSSWNGNSTRYPTTLQHSKGAVPTKSVPRVPDDRFVTISQGFVHIPRNEATSHSSPARLSAIDRTPPRVNRFALPQEGSRIDTPVQDSLTLTALAAPYPQSLVGSPDYVGDPFALATVRFSSDRERCVGAVMAHVMKMPELENFSSNTLSHPSGMPWESEKYTLEDSSFDSPGSHVRRARDRLRDLRRGLERSTSNPCIVPRLS